MKVLVTGAQGFIGQNLIVHLQEQKIQVLPFDVDTNPNRLEDYCRDAEFVYHLAGVNRPQDPAEYMAGNFGFTSVLLDTLKRHNNRCPVMLASSIQASRDNPYGLSKKAGEDLLFRYQDETGAEVLIYRFPNVFGKWCRPNYNSVVATFCYNIARDIPISVYDPVAMLRLTYIDDVVSELLRALQGDAHREGAYCRVPTEHEVALGALADLIQQFKKSRQDRTVSDMSDPFVKKMYSTYLSYLPTDAFGYDLFSHLDARGSFTEFIRTPDRGQMSVNVSHPGIVKGNHYHHTKTEKFLVVSGRGVIRFRKIGSDEVIIVPVSGDKLHVVDIPPGYTHNIENLGDTAMITLMWANESFDPDHPDTIYLEV